MNNPHLQIFQIAEMALEPLQLALEPTPKLANTIKGLLGAGVSENSQALVLAREAAIPVVIDCDEVVQGLLNVPTKANTDK